MQWTVHIYVYVDFTKVKLNQNIMQTCFNPFEAVSKATIASYGAFFAELHAVHDARVRSRRINEKSNVSATRKPARRARHTSTTKTPYQIHLYMRNLKLCRRTTGSLLWTSGFEAVPSLIQPKLWILHLRPRPNKTSKAGPNPCR